MPKKTQDIQAGDPIPSEGPNYPPFYGVDYGGGMYAEPYIPGPDTDEDTSNRATRSPRGGTSAPPMAQMGHPMLHPAMMPLMKLGLVAMMHRLFGGGQ